jgi:hypothetical protein
MKKQLFLTAVLALMLQVTSFAQSIKLNNEGDPGSAMLEVNSASKGILIPNVTLTGITDATTITLPAVSLLVYNTATVSDVEPGYYYNSGTAVSPFWSRLSTSTSPGTAGDGSETKVTAGTNVTVTGSGTSASPYVVNSTEVDGDVTNELQDLSINGNTLKITLNGAATAIDLSAYLDNTDNQTLDGILTLNTSAGDKKITNLGYPVSAQDAATKAYVDGEITSLPTITTYAIGDSAHGGIVFWVDETGQHGLVCAKSDQSSGIRWYAGTYGNTRAKGDGLYAGKANTSIIISSQVAIGDDGSAYAAQLCNDLQITEVGTTFGDWYLPSKFELNEMWKNLHRFGCTNTFPASSPCATAIGGFSSGYYWSSTENDLNNAWLQIFSIGYQDSVNKYSYGFSVRAVRAF